MLFMSVVLTGQSAFKVCVGYGTMLDEDGKKFSKTGPKNIPFDEGVELYGADPLRYVFSTANPALDMRFGPNMVDEARRKLLAFMNAVTFYQTYATIDKPKPLDHVPSQLDVTDVWLVERLNKYVAECDAAYESYNEHLVVAATDAFDENQSNFYIRTNRRRFWKGGKGIDKANAFWALYHAIRVITIALSPIAPFMAEHVWQTVIRPNKGEVESVLISDFPSAIKIPTEERIPKIIERVEFIQQVTTLAHRLRAQQMLKLKQPLRTMFVKADKRDMESIKLFANFLREELNVKSVEIVESEDKFNIPYLIVNFKVAGRELGGRVQELKTALEKLTEVEMAKVVAAFVKSSKIAVPGFKSTKPLSHELFIKQLKSKSEFVSDTQEGVTVVLDTTLDAGLIEEGKLRELIRQIQVARQVADLDISARIALCLRTKSPVLSDIIAKNTRKICDEVLAKELVTTKPVKKQTHVSEVDVDGETVTISLSVYV